MHQDKRARILRITSLSGFFVFLTWIAYMHQVKGGGPAGVPPIDAFCPMGGLETLKTWLSEGAFLKRTSPSALVLFGTVGVMTLLFGRTFCGWICPLGAMGELPSFLAKKAGLPQVSFPDSIDNHLKKIKYLVLLVILWGTMRFGYLFWRDYDPWVAWAHLSAGWDEIVTRPWGVIILATTVLGAALFIERFWCRYLCPLGAALGIISKISFLKVGNKTLQSCSSCAHCSKACPVQLKPERETVSSAECLVCGRCVTAALPKCQVGFRLRGKPVSVLKVGICTLLVFFGGYGIARSTGAWQTFVPPTVTSNMTPQQVADSVFGWMNLKQISNTTGIPIEKIKEKAALPLDTPENQSTKKLGIDDNKIKEAIVNILTEQKSQP